MGQHSVAHRGHHSANVGSHPPCILAADRWLTLRRVRPSWPNLCTRPCPQALRSARSKAQPRGFAALWVCASWHPALLAPCPPVQHGDGITPLRTLPLPQAGSPTSSEAPGGVPAPQPAHWPLFTPRRPCTLLHLSRVPSALLTVHTCRLYRIIYSFPPELQRGHSPFHLPTLALTGCKNSS